LSKDQFCHSDKRQTELILRQAQDDKIVFTKFGFKAV